MILQLDDINTYYGYSHILQGISLEVQQGQIFCLLGRNGVGKTTTLRSIMGINPARQGRIKFNDEEITGWPTYRIAQAGVGFVPEDRRIFPNLTVSENLRVVNKGKGKTKGWTLDRVFDKFPRLKERAGQKGGTLSGGEQQMLAIGRCLMGNPQLMLLDEPSQGLAPIMVSLVADIIRSLCYDSKITVLLVEQNLRLALSLAHYNYLISKGRIVYNGPTDEIKNNEAIINKYLTVG